VELVDAKDLKSFGSQGPCGFKSRPRHKGEDNMTIETRYELKESVLIVALDRKEIVIGIWLGDSGLKYLVRYFDNAEAREIYFYPEELA
jgi:hypothetical protein